MRLPVLYITVHHQIPHSFVVDLQVTTTCGKTLDIWVSTTRRSSTHTSLRLDTSHHRLLRKLYQRDRDICVALGQRCCPIPSSSTSCQRPSDRTRKRKHCTRRTRRRAQSRRDRRKPGAIHSKWAWCFDGTNPYHFLRREVFILRVN